MDVRYSRHASRQMLVRNIARDEVEAALTSGEVVESYPGDQP
jgi:hypothetical protein